MSLHLNCVVPNSTDKAIADAMFGEVGSSQFVAMVRDLYAKDHPNEPEIISITEFNKALSYYKESKAKANLEEAYRKMVDDSSNSLQTINRLFGAVAAKSETNHLTTVCSLVIDNLVKKYEQYGISRKEIIKGIPINGTLVGGMEYIISEAILNKYGDAYSYNGSDESVKGRIIELSNLKAQTSTEEDRQKIQDQLDLNFQVLSEWHYFVPSVKRELGRREGVKLGFKFNYAESRDILSDLEESDNVETYYAEEATRERWQEVINSIPLLSTVGQQVRELLARMPKVNLDTGEYIRDAFGNLQTQSPGKTCRTILDSIKGSSTAEELLEDLRYLAISQSPTNSANIDNNPYQQLCNLLSENRELLTAFYCGLHRNFTLYLTEDTSYEKGSRKNHLSIRNRISKNSLINKFISVLTSKRELAYTSIFKPDKKGKVRFNIENWETIPAAIEKLNSVKNNPNGGNFKALRSELISVFKLLGVMSDSESLIKENERIVTDLMRSPKALNEVLNALKTLQEHSTLIGGNLDKADPRKIFDLTIQGATKGLSGIYYDIIKNIPSVLGDTKFSSAIRFAKNLRISHTTPSWLGTFMGSVRRYADRGEAGRRKLRALLETKYGIKRDSEGKIKSWNPSLVAVTTDDKGTQTVTFRNALLQALYTSKGLSNELATNFFNGKLLGNFDGSKTDDNFSSLDNLLTQLSAFKFFSKDRAKRDRLAMYPVFILGDSNSIEFITGLKESNAAIKSHYVEAFLQDVTRMDLAVAVRKKMTIDGKSTNAPFSKNACRFSWVKCMEFKSDKPLLEKGSLFVEEDGKTPLPFYDINGIELTEEQLKANSSLRSKESQMNNWNKFVSRAVVKVNIDNPVISKEYHFDTLISMAQNSQKSIEEGGDNTFKEQIIGSYLDEEFEKFKAKAEALDLYRQTYGKYSYIQSFTKEGENFDDFLRNFFYNYKYHMVCQHQMATIDVAFYPSSKTQQKRNKQIHSPGTELDLTAIDTFCKRDSSSYKNPLFTHILPNGETVEGMQTALYYNDIKVNSEETNPEFMKVVILNNLADQSEENRKKVSEELNELVTPGENDEIRLSKIQSLLTENGFKIYKSFRENTLTDGQSHRTLKSYRAISIASASWNIRQERVYRKIQEVSERARLEGRELTKEERKEIEDCRVVFQPKKPQYFGFEHFLVNETTTATIPVQHKCSEAILIPCLMDKGSKLRDIAEYMEEKDIDVLASSEVVKVGGWGFADISASDTSTLRGNLDRGAIHYLGLEGYKVQSNVSEHLNEDELLPTQSRKTFLQGINAQRDYSSYINGREVLLNVKKTSLSNGHLLSQFFQQVVTSLMVRSNEEQWEPVVDSDKNLSTALTQNALNSDRILSDKIQSFFFDGKAFTTPLNELSNEYSVESTLISMFKKLVNKQKSDGGTAVHESALGGKGYEVDGGLKIVCKDGNVEYWECEEAFSYTVLDSKRNEIELDYDEYVDENGYPRVNHQTGETLLEERFPGIQYDYLVRIPVEGFYSIVRTKAVRFHRKTEGATRKYPPEITTILGLDFDIDKGKYFRHIYQFKPLDDTAISEAWKDFYSKHPEVKKALQKARDEESELINIDNLEEYITLNGKLVKNRLWKYWEEAGLEGTAREALENHIKTMRLNYRFEEWDYNKSIDEQSTVALKNMYHTLMMERLRDRETLSARITPGGFPDASQTARTMREIEFGEYKEGQTFKNTVDKTKQINWEDPEPDYDATDPFTWIIYNNLNQIAGKLIGTFANHNTNHNLMNVLKVFQTSSKYSIVFGSMIGAKAFRESYTSSGNKINVEVKAGNALNAHFLVRSDGSIIKPANTLAQLLASSVDAVKDPVLNYLGINNYTASVTCALARLGYSFDDIGLLLNQPAIKEITKYCEDHNTRNISKAIKAIKDRYKSGKVVSAGVELTQDVLYENLVPSNEVDERVQLKVLEVFETLTTISKSLQGVITDTKFTASNAIKTTFGDIYHTLMSIEDRLKAAQEDPVLQIVTEDGLPLHNCINSDFKVGTNKFSIKEYLKIVANNPFMFEQCQFDLAKRMLLKVVNGRFQYETEPFKVLREKLREINPSYTPSGEDIESVHRDFTLFGLLYHRPDSNTLTENGSIVTSILGSPLKEALSKHKYYTYVFPKELKELTSDSTNSIGVLLNTRFAELFGNLEYIDTPYDKNFTITSIRFSNLGDLEVTDKEAIIEKWGALAELGYSDDENAEIYKKIAEGLFYYNLFKNGTKFSYSSLDEMCPDIIKENIQIGNSDYPLSYKEFFRRITEEDFLFSNIDYEDNIYYDAFFRKWVLNHLDYKHMHTVSTKQESSIKDIFLTVPGQTSFTLELGRVKSSDFDNGNGLIIYTDKNDVTATTWAPALSMDGKIYLADNPGGFNKGTSCTYKLVKKSAMPTTSTEANYIFDHMDNYSSEIYASTEEEAATDSQIPSSLKEPGEDEPITTYDATTDSINKWVEDTTKSILLSDEVDPGIEPKTIKDILNEFVTDYIEEVSNRLAERGISETSTSIKDELNNIFNESRSELVEKMKSEDTMCK